MDLNFRRIYVIIRHPLVYSVSSKTRILICDDHTLFVEGIKAMFRNESSLEIVGEARDGRRAVELVKEIKPDLLLMDVSMPDMNGPDATQADGIPVVFENWKAQSQGRNPSVQQQGVLPRGEFVSPP